MSNGSAPSVSGLSSRVGETVTLKGWLYNRRDSGKIRFLVLRDGSGYLQCVVVKKEVPEEVWESSGPAHAGVDLRGDRRRPGGAPPGGRRRARRHGPDGPLPLPRLADHAEGARRRLPDVAAAPLAPVGEAGRDPEGEERGRERDPRLLPLARLHEGRLADPDAERLRGDLEPLRDAVHRGREGLPLAVGAALPRAGRRGPRQGLLLRPDVPGREVEDAAAPARVLDGRARGRLPGDRRPEGRSPRSSSRS